MPIVDPIPPASDRSGVRVGVVGLAHPPEPFLERLLTGLTAQGMQIVLVGATAPPRSWLRARGWGWQRAPWITRLGAARRLVGDRTRRPSPLGPLGAQLDDRSVDVLYAPWPSTPAEHPELFELGPPVVVSCRGSQVTVAPWNPERRLGAQLPEVFARAAAVHCVSEAIRRDAQRLGLDAAKATVIRPAVDVEAHAPARARGSEEPLRVVGVGSLSWLKDYETAIRAVAAAVAHGLDVELRIVGDGPDVQRLHFARADLGLEGRVHLLGRRTPSEVAQLLASSHVFLHTSGMEGVSNAVLEAMASALAVICTDVGGMGEVIEDGVDGLLVPVRAPERIAALLGDLAADPARRAALGTAARRRVQHHHRLADQVDAFGSLLARVAGEVR